jgi:hypothetical protein
MYRNGCLKNMRTVTKTNVKVLDVAAVAILLGKSQRSVRRWFAAGEIENKAGFTDAGRPCRVTTRGQLTAFMRRRGITPRASLVE